jgi:hypothetical protein
VDDLEVFARTHRHDKGKGQYASKKAEKLVVCILLKHQVISALQKYYAIASPTI